MLEKKVKFIVLGRIGEGNGNLLQCSCLENPRDGGASGAAVYGVARSRTRLKQLLKKGTPLASRVAQGVSGPSSSCVWNPRVFADGARAEANKEPVPSDTFPKPAPSRARTLEAGERWARLAQARAASRPGLCAIAPGR